MGVWAFYKGLPQKELEDIRNEINVTVNEHIQTDETSIECEIGKSWYGLHEILTQGLTEPTEDNIFSNAVAGQYVMWGDNSEWGNGVWWWNCYTGAYNDNKRVQEIAKALQGVDFNVLLNIHKSENNNKFTDDFYRWMEWAFKELQDLYTKCAELNYAVRTNFG